MEKVVRYSLALGVAAFFAVMWGLLLRAHLTVGPSAPLQPFYDNLLGPGETERTSTWGVYFGDRRIGKAQTRVWRDESGMISVRTTTEIQLTAAIRFVLGLTGTLDVEFVARISPLRGLESFDVESKLLNVQVMGTVAGGNMLITGRFGENDLRTNVPYDQDRLLSEVLSPLTALPQLSEDLVGRDWTLDMVNPVVGTVEQVTVTVVGFKDVELAEGLTRVFRLLFATRSTRWVCWVTEEGQVLMQGTPFGLTLQREDIPAEAVKELKRDPVRNE